MTRSIRTAKSEEKLRSNRHRRKKLKNHSAIAVEGNGDSEWIWLAKAIDSAGPIVTALLKKVFEPRQFMV